MEQKKEQICISDKLPILSSSYPWLVAHNLEPEGDQVFYTIDDPKTHYRCRIPELAGRSIRGSFHGWMVFSNHPHDVKWSLWNPVTSKFISLPRLILKDGASDDILHCCLSSSPDDPGSILLLTRYMKPTIVFCRLDRKRKRLRWIEMSCSKQLTSITGRHDSFLVEPTCCNGKVYASVMASRPLTLVQIHIAVKENDVVIRLLPIESLPVNGTYGDRSALFLKGSGPELFTIEVGITKEKPVEVCLHKLDMNNMVWIEMKDLKDTVFFVDLAGDQSVGCSPAIASKFGGYIHFLHKTGRVIYSYDVKDKTISMSSMDHLDFPPRSETREISVWPVPEIRFEGDNVEAKCKGDPIQTEGKGYEMVVRFAMNDEVGLNEPWEHKNEEHLNIPFDILETIMKFCVGIEYLNFRATCKLCCLVAPMIQWSNERTRLQTYSLVSPWLMTLDKDQGLVTFIDPMFGDNKYFIKASPELFNDGIKCSRYGWLLLFIEINCLVFFNPFTGDKRKLPPVDYTADFSCCFSAPPTSPDCMVVAFSPYGPRNVFIHSVAGESSWNTIELIYGDGDPCSSFPFPTICGQDVYALYNKGGLDVFRAINDPENCSWEMVVDTPRSTPSAEYFHANCDQHHLLVIVREFGGSVEVFKLNDDTYEWEKIDGLGRHTIYISDTSCVCMDAKTPEMENKIYFPRLNCDNGKIVFYSMETRRFHTFNGRNVEQNNAKDLFGTKQCIIYTQAWIEPTWS